MAKKLEECTRLFTQIKTALMDSYSEITKMRGADNVCDAMLKQASVSIGQRVQELKDGGANGTTIDDFKNDGEVKTFLKSIDDGLASVAKQIQEAATAQGAAVKQRKAFEALQQELTSEVQQRKSKKIAFFKIQSKSLPELEKLVAEMKKFEDSKVWSDTEENDFTDFEGVAARRQAVDALITKEISQTRAESQADDTDMKLAALEIRRLKGTTNKVRVGHDIVMAEARNLIEARKNGDPNAVTAALQKADQAFKIIDPLAKEIKRVSEDSQIKFYLKTSKYKAEIDKNVKSILTWHSDAAGVLQRLR